MRRRCCAAMSLLAVLLCAVHAHGDGLYFKSARYTSKPPGIPAQRAFIGFKDGVERLVVESTVDSEGPALAWVLPVPATPTEVREVSPGFLKTLSLNVGAIVRDNMMPRFVATAILALVLGGWAFHLLCVCPRFRAALGWLAASLVVGFFFAGWLASGARSAGVEGGGGPVPVHVLRAGTVGSYEVSVLEAPNAPALDTWLAENGFAALPEGGHAVIEQYIREGWRFVASKLRPEGEGLMRPHPLEIVFPSKQAVYPMRLTALAGSEVYVELYVAAATGVRNERLKTQASVKLHLPAPGESPESTMPARLYPSYASLGHADVRKHLWDGCRLTRLDCTIGPDQMEKDLVLETDSSEPFTMQYYTAEAAQTLAGTIGLQIGLLVLVPTALAATLFGNRRRKRGALLMSVALALLAGVATAYLVQRGLPRAEEQNMASPRGGSDTNHVNEAVAALSRSNPGLERMDAGQAQALMQEYFTATKAVNVWTGEPILFEDSPGNLLLESENGLLICTTYNLDGRPYRRPVAEMIGKSQQGHS